MGRVAGGNGGLNFVSAAGMADISPNTATVVTGISVAIASAGSSATNANLPPYLGIFFIIKT
jgi:microcystin-dependent protein